MLPQTNGLTFSKRITPIDIIYNDTIVGRITRTQKGTFLVTLPHVRWSGTFAYRTNNAYGLSVPYTKLFNARTDVMVMFGLINIRHALYAEFIEGYSSPNGVYTPNIDSAISKQYGHSPKNIKLLAQNFITRIGWWEDSIPDEVTIPLISTYDLSIIQHALSAKAHRLNDMLWKI